MKHRKELLTHFWLYWFSTLRVEWLAQMGLEVTCLSCWFGVQADLVEQEWFMTRDISSVEIFLLSWVEENSSNLQALRYNMSLLHIHFMKVRAGCPWSFASDLAHDNCLPFLHRRSQAVLRWWLCAGVSAWHSSSVQISAHILALVQGKEACEEQKAGEKRQKGFYLQG